MPKLTKKIRDSIAANLQDRLPSHWRVVAGAPGCAFIEVDQDGRKLPNAFHAVGSKVIRIQNAKGNKVIAEVFERIAFPPGYCEGRKFLNAIETPMGRGWQKLLEKAVLASVGESDAAAATPAEA